MKMHAFPRHRNKTNRATVARARLHLELLEDRNLLSQIPAYSGFTDLLLNPNAANGQGTLGEGDIKNASGPLGTTSSMAANVNTDGENVPGAHNETSIAVNPTNPLNLIGSVNDFQVRLSAGGQTNTTVLSRAHVSFDGGHTWTIYPIDFTGYNSTGDPAVAFDADGTAYLATLAFTVGQNGKAITGGWAVVAHSHDGGVTWSAPVKVAKGTGSGPSAGTFPDKEYVTAWGHGNAILTYTEFDIGDNGEFLATHIKASVTHDGGQTWTSPTSISGSFLFNQFSSPVVAADGSIYVAFVNGDLDVAPQFRDHYVVVKVDPATGQALQAPVDVGLVYDGVADYPINIVGRMTYQDSEFRTNPAGNLAADPTNALHLAVVWSDMRNNPYPGALLPSLDPYQVKTNSDIIVSQSFDGGKNWSAPHAIPLPGDQFMPWGAYDATGKLQIGFFDRSYDPANHKYGYTVASETTAGSLNFKTTQVTTALSDPTKGNLWFAGTTVNSNFPHPTTFLGDYSNIAVTPTGVSALWTDLRNQVSFNGQTGSGQDAFYTDPPSAGPTAAPAPFASSGPISASGKSAIAPLAPSAPAALASLAISLGGDASSFKPARAPAAPVGLPRADYGRTEAVNAGQDLLPARSQQAPRVSESSGDAAALDVIFQDDFSPEEAWFSDWGPELVW